MIYHYRNRNIVDESVVKLESTYTPKQNENADLENTCKELEHTKISLFKTKDNLHTLRKELDSLIKKIENKEIKGSIIVVISPDYYWNICQSHISDTSYYRMLHDTDPSKILQQRVTQFADKYKSMLTLLNRKEAQNFKIT